MVRSKVLTQLPPNPRGTPGTSVFFLLFNLSLCLKASLPRMAGTLKAITSFHKTSEGEATGPTGALFYPVVQCVADACPRIEKCELISVSQKVSLSSVLEAVQDRKQSEV